MIQDLIALLFHSRDYAHRAHLRTNSYSTHMALGEFYEQMTEAADKLTESWQGRCGMLDIGYYTPSTLPDPIVPLEVLTGHKHMVMQMRQDPSLQAGGTPTQNQIDEIETIFDRTLYKLTFLK